MAHEVYENCVFAMKIPWASEKHWGVICPGKNRTMKKKSENPYRKKRKKRVIARKLTYLSLSSQKPRVLNNLLQYTAPFTCLQREGVDLRRRGLEVLVPKDPRLEAPSCMGVWRPRAREDRRCFVVKGHFSEFCFFSSLLSFGFPLPPVPLATSCAVYLFLLPPPSCPQKLGQLKYLYGL